MGADVSSSCRIRPQPFIVGGFLGLVLAGAPTAQTTGRIEGRATEPDATPLPGVTITASSAALQGRRSVATEGDGRFVLSFLPPGLYSVSARLDGFNPLEIGGLRVGLDETLTLELELSRAFGDAVTVRAEAPMVDVTRPATGTNVSKQVFQSLPTARTFDGLAIMAPGVTEGVLPDDPVGVSNYSIRGASAAENRYLVDGLDITDVLSGLLDTTLAFEFVQEVQVKTGGYEVDYGGALGGVLNVVTRSGGNAFQGDLFAFFTDDGLQASTARSEEFGQRLGFTEYDFGLDVGGKLIEDELWYFLALNPAIRTDKIENRQGLAFEPDADSLYWAGKLSWQPGPSHRLVGSHFGESRDSTRVERNAAGRIVDDHATDYRSYAISYTATLTPSLLLEMVGGRFDTDNRGRPSDEPSPLYLDSTQTGFWARQQDCGDPEPLSGGGVNFVVGCSGGTGAGDSAASRDQVRASASWLSGKHELKAGVEYREVSAASSWRPPAPFPEPLVADGGVVIDPDGVEGAGFILTPDGSHILLVREGSNAGTTEELALFVEDQWRLDPSLSLNLGVRVNSIRPRGRSGGEIAASRLEFGLEDMIAPRLSLVWDPTRRGRSRLFAGIGRYYESIAMSNHLRTFAGDGEFSLRFFLNPWDGSLPGYRNLGTYLGGFGGADGGYAVDPATRPMHTDEIIVGFDFQPRSDLAVGIRGIQRRVDDVIEDISLDLGGAYSWFLTNPGGTYRTDPVSGAPLPEPETYPRPVREYRALELTLDKRLRDDWQLFASYVYSENEGNYPGLIAPLTDQIGHLTAGFDFSEHLRGAHGPLPTDRPHQLKVYGSYLWDFGLTAGFHGAWVSGTPISKLGGHPGYPPGSRFVTPRGDAGRTDDVWFLDLRLEQPIQLRSGLELRVIVDLFNATNQQAATQVDQIWTYDALERTLDPAECGGPGTGPGTSCPAGNPLWGSALDFQRPRALRFGAKLSW